MRPFLLSLLISCSMVYSQNGNCKGGGTICLESSSFDAKDSIRVFFPTTFFSVDTSTRFILKMYNGDLNSDPNSELCNPNKNRVSLVPLQQWTVPGNSPSILDGYSLGYTDVKINVQDPGILKALEVDPSFFFQISANVTGGSQCLLGPLTPFTHVSLVLSSVIPASSTSRTSSNLPSNTMSRSPSSGPLDLTKEAFIGIILAIVLIFLALMAFLVFIILRKRKLGKKKFDTVQSTNIKKRVSFVPDNTVISTTSSIDILFPFAETSSSSSNPPSPSILPPTENPFDDPVVQNHAHDSALLIAESYRQALNNPARAGPMKRELSSGSRKSQTFGELLKEI